MLAGLQERDTMSLVEQVDNATPAVNAADARRHEIRAHIRRQIAEGRAAREKAKAFRTAKREVDQQIDAAADEHERKCQPLQAELSDIEAQVVELLTNGQPTPPEVESRRHELMREVSVATNEFELKLEALKRSKADLEAKAVEVVSKAPQPQTLENELAGEYAHPQLRATLEAAMIGEQWTIRRMQSAHENIEKTNGLIHRVKGYRLRSDEWRQTNGGPEPQLPKLESLERRLRKWKAESSAALKAHNEQVAAVEAARQACINE